MLLQEIMTGNLVKIVDVQSLINPMECEVTIRLQAGEEEQDPELKSKEKLRFLSGENLPKCWTDVNYGNESYSAFPM